MQKVIRNLEERIRGFDYDKLIDEKTELLQKSSRIDNQVRHTPSMLLFIFPCFVFIDIFFSIFVYLSNKIFFPLSN